MMYQLSIVSRGRRCGNSCDDHLRESYRESYRERYRERYREISRAIRNAAPAATPPINAVCRPLRIGLTPVKRPLTAPKISRAHSVTTTETRSAMLGCGMRI